MRKLCAVVVGVLFALAASGICLAQVNADTPSRDTKFGFGNDFGYVITLPTGETYTIRAMPYSGPPTVRGENKQELWQKAGTAYEAGDYVTAERSFGAIEKLDLGFHDAVLYRGVALMMAGRHDEAMKQLERARQIADDQDLPGSSDNWYLSLCTLAAGDVPKATEKLRLIEATGGPYADDARELLALL